MPLLSPAIQRAAQRPWVAAALIVVAIALCYSNSLSAEFFFDDLEAIVRNPTIRSLSPLSRVLVTPPGSSVGARPLVNLSFALNYAVGELDVRGYRLVNIAIHMTTALLLFGLVRRTLLLPRVAAKYDLPALPVATAVAMLWAVHPLHTEVVTYVTHRNECLMGMLLLACLYCVRRSVDARRPRAWHAAAVVACFAGAASKEVMAVAPLIVLLYDRTFLAGTFAVALRKRRGLYVALASSWFLLGVLVAGTHGRGGAAGYGLSVSLWEYLTTQAWAIVHYLRLAVWPAPLVVDYGALIVDDPRQWLVPGVAVLLLLSLTGYLLIRRPMVGFLGAWFFIILAPSSSIVPLVTQTVAEKRMYLPLAAVVVLGVCAGGRILRVVLCRCSTDRDATMTLRWAIPTIVIAASASALAGATLRRNADYTTQWSIWTDTLSKRPDNPRAHLNVGVLTFESGEFGDALAHFDKAIELRPNYAEARYNRAITLWHLDEFERAIPDFTAAIDGNHRVNDAMLNRGIAHAMIGQNLDAVRDLSAFLARHADHAEALYWRGVAYHRLGRSTEAVRDLRRFQASGSHLPMKASLSVDQILGSDEGRR